MAPHRNAVANPTQPFLGSESRGGHLRNLKLPRRPWGAGDTLEWRAGPCGHLLCTTATNAPPNHSNVGSATLAGLSGDWIAVRPLLELQLLKGREKVPTDVAEHDEALVGRATNGCEVNSSTALGLLLGLRWRQRLMRSCAWFGRSSGTDGVLSLLLILHMA